MSYVKILYNCYQLLAEVAKEACGSVHPPLSVRPAYWLMEVTPQNLYVLM